MLPPETDAYRVLDGEGDGYEDVFVDYMAGRWLISTRGREIPQAIYDELREKGDTVYHKRLELDDKKSPKLILGEPCEGRFVVKEAGLKFLLDFTAGYSQGLFLDQRLNRMRVRELIGKGDRLLNTFAYTGGFSLAAAMAGAVTTTLDLAQPCLTWGQENMRENGVDPSAHYFCKGDTVHWLSRFAKQMRTFHGIVLDPPTFSRDKNGRLWRVDRDFGELVARAHLCMEEGGWILCSTNCRKLSSEDFLGTIRDHLPRSMRCEAGKMPPDFTGEQYLKVVWCFHEA